MCIEIKEMQLKQNHYCRFNFFRYNLSLFKILEIKVNIMLITRASEYAILSLIVLSKASSPIDSETLSNQLSILDFIISNWGELVIGLLAFAKIIVNLTPTDSDNAVFGWFDTFISTIINDRRKS